MSLRLTRLVPVGALLLVLSLAFRPLGAQAMPKDPATFARSLRPGTPTVIESSGPRVPNKVVFEDDGETGYFYALDVSQPDSAQVVDAISIYQVAKLNRAAKPDSVRITWAADGGKAALFFNGRAEAVFDFDRKRGYARSGSPMPAVSPWPRSDHSWDERALAGVQ